MVGDFVLLRANGLPTYNFAAAVDDAAMRISHVIRAEEHLPNTPRQLMIYAALGETPPRFAHVPLILNRDRSKMSKREGEAAVSVGEWRRAGYVAEALLSYLALLGFHPGDDREILSRAELLEAFTLDRVGKSGAVFDPDKLRWTNAHVLHHASGALLHRWMTEGMALEADAPEWTRTFERMTQEVPRASMERMLELIHGNVTTLADVPGELGALLDEPVVPEPDAVTVLGSPRAHEVCAAFADELIALADWSAAGVKSALLRTGERLGLKGRELFQPPRAALTGRVHGPELPQVIELLGRDQAVARLRRVEAARSS